MDRASGSHGDDSRGEERFGSGRFVLVELLTGVVDDGLVTLISDEASPLGVACVGAAGGGSLTMVGE